MFKQTRPVHRTRTSYTDTLEKACRLAIRDDRWENAQQEPGSIGETCVTAAWLGGDPAYGGGAKPDPSRYQQSVQRRSDQFDTLLAVLKEVAQPMGLLAVSRLGGGRESRGHQTGRPRP